MDDDRPRERLVPAYDLEDVVAAAASGELHIGARVRRYLSRQGWDAERVVSCISDLSREDFHKAQQHREREDVWLDIYRPRRGHERLYIKFVAESTGAGYRLLSFCRDGESH